MCFLNYTYWKILTTSEHLSLPWRAKISGWCPAKRQHSTAEFSWILQQSGNKSCVALWPNLEEHHWVLDIYVKDYLMSFVISSCWFVLVCSFFLTALSRTHTKHTHTYTCMYWQRNTWLYTSYLKDLCSYVESYCESISGKLLWVSFS